jgi:hypothetical protein
MGFRTDFFFLPYIAPESPGGVGLGQPDFDDFKGNIHSTNGLKYLFGPWFVLGNRSNRFNLLT